eukprot:TRINITY_DN2760_c0_g1_i1.p1 TRINITY_DN2760_c0_g1~~TRINITY_DN2760_c0_g1_i1.p1  ORF type:complete len:1308 (+),score=451.39 TRINITY_DN2760_c0_g1_i1:228-3926(+)
MGGHTIAPRGAQIDMRYMDKILWIDPKKRQVLVEVGATWERVIFAVNKYGLSPRTLQSYCTFSVGGSISVNAHGITSDECVGNSVESLQILTWDGQMKSCSREENSELFRSAIGGYGLFGIIYSACLRLVPNCKIYPDQPVRLEWEKFFDVYPTTLTSHDPTIQVKLARVDLTNWDHITLYVYKSKEAQHSWKPTSTIDLRVDETHGERSNLELIEVSQLGLTPVTQNMASRLFYKWIVPTRTFRQVRSTMESITGHPLDWKIEESTRNELVFFSAQPLATLYEPLIHLDVTFILQEFFVPMGKGKAWYQHAKEIMNSWKNQPSYWLTRQLNLTVRFVEADKDSRLPYAPIDSYAFVFYYWVRQSTAGYEEMQRIHSQLAEITIQLEGRFYLPYLHHYTDLQLKEAYGEKNLEEFAEFKMKFDPIGRFQNKWFDRYFGEISRNFPASDAPFPEFSPPQTSRNFPEPLAKFPRAFVTVMGNPEFRDRLRLFFIHIFTIVPADEMFQLVEDALFCSGKIPEDSVVYDNIVKLLKERKGIFSIVENAKRSLALAKETDKSIRDQAATLLGKLGMSKFHGVLSVGDGGEAITNLGQEVDLTGRMVTITDSPASAPVLSLRCGVDRIRPEIFEANFSDADVPMFPNQVEIQLENEIETPEILSSRKNLEEALDSLERAENSLKIRAADIEDLKLNLQVEENSVKEEERLSSGGKYKFGDLTKRFVRTLAPVDSAEISRLKTKILQVKSKLIEEEQELKIADRELDPLRERVKTCRLQLEEIIQVETSKFLQHQDTLPEILPESFDLIVIWPGLHHFQVEKRAKFLRNLEKWLRPNGILLLREHDTLVRSHSDPTETLDITPIVHVAHEVFNAVTGVDAESNRKEIRRVRPLTQWIEILRAHNFEPCYQYEMDPNDPTEDVIAAFRKKRAKGEVPAVSSRIALLKKLSEEYNIPLTEITSVNSFYELPEWMVVDMAKDLGTFLQHTPWYEFPYMKMMKNYFSRLGNAYGQVKETQGTAAALTAPGLAMNAVVGCVTGVIFAQMAALSLPLKLAMGRSQDELKRNAKQHMKRNPQETGKINTDEIIIDENAPVGKTDAEQVLIFGCDDIPNSARIIFQDEKNKDILLLEIPRHVPFTRILQEIAHRNPEAIIGAIDGQMDVINVRLTLNEADEDADRIESWLESNLKECRIYDRYQNPVNAMERYVAISVPIPQLCQLLRGCSTTLKESIRDVWVYDLG